MERGKVSGSKQASHWQYLVKTGIASMLSFLFKGPNKYLTESSTLVKIEILVKGRII